MNGKNSKDGPEEIAFLRAIFIKEGKRLFIFNEKRSDPIAYPSLFAVPLVETSTFESNVAILIQSKKLRDNELEPILYNVHGIIENQPEIKKYNKLYKTDKLVISPSEVTLPNDEHTHKRYQMLLEIVMDDCAEYYKIQNSQ